MKKIRWCNTLAFLGACLTPTIFAIAISLRYETVVDVNYPEFILISIIFGAGIVGLQVSSNKKLYSCFEKLHGFKQFLSTIGAGAGYLAFVGSFFLVGNMLGEKTITDDLNNTFWVTAGFLGYYLLCYFFLWSRRITKEYCLTFVNGWAHYPKKRIYLCPFILFEIEVVKRTIPRKFRDLHSSRNGIGRDTTRKIVRRESAA